MTGIVWTDVTWNPTTGCDRVSDGCDHCYALTLAKRLKGMGSAKYQTDGDPRTSGPGFGLAVHPDTLGMPLRWKTPRRVFVNSMSDLFHDQVPDEFVARVFAVMAATPRHTYQLLTKRHARMRSLLNNPEWRNNVFLRSRVLTFTCPPRPLPTWPLPNLWLGVSVENQQWANIRVPALLGTPAAVRWLSCEPLLGPVDLTGRPVIIDGKAAPVTQNWLTGHLAWQAADSAPVAAIHLAAPRIAWVVTGGESGPGYRPAATAWFRDIRDQCKAAGVAFLHKQNGGHTPKSGGRELDGRTYDEYPDGAT